jgi:hypothetical protein
MLGEKALTLPLPFALAVSGSGTEVFWLAKYRCWPGAEVSTFRRLELTVADIASLSLSGPESEGGCLTGVESCLPDLRLTSALLVFGVALVGLEFSVLELELATETAEAAAAARLAASADMYIEAR